MRLLQLYLLQLFIGCCLAGFSQQPRHTVSGTIRDKATGEVLIGATAVFLEKPGSRAFSNAYGFYSLSAAPGNYHLIISFSGYKSDTLKIELIKDIQWQASL